MSSFVPARRARHRPGLSPALRSWLVVFVFAVLAAVQYGHAGTAYAQEVIPPNVTVAGVPVGGLDAAGARDALEQHFSGLLSNTVTLTLGSRVWAIPAGELGTRLDLTTTVAQALTATLTMSADGPQVDVPLALGHDRGAAELALRRIASEVNTAASPADIILTQEKLELVPEIAGTRMETETTWLNIVSATHSLPLTGTATQVVTATIQPTITAASLAQVYDQAVAMSSQPLTLTAPMSGTVMAFGVQSDALRSLLVLEREQATGKPTGVKLPDEHLNAYAGLLAEKIDHEVEDARLVLPDYEIETAILSEVPGRDLDVKGTAKQLRAAITTKGAKRVLALPVKITPPKILSEQLKDAKSRIDAQLTRSMELRYAGKSYTLTPEQLVLALYLNTSQDGNPDGYSLRIEDVDLARVMRRAASEIDVTPRDATYRLIRGRARMVEAPAEGLMVDQPSAVPVLREALINGSVALDLPIKPVAPGYSFTGLSAIATPDLLGEAQTFYGYSSPERSWNVTLGASRLDGWYVAPGASFSFNEAIGPLTLDAGFKMGWAIQVQGGSAKTIPSEAGGICQVATTLFQGTFWSGLEVTERRNHSYWIATYGKEPSGLQGLDATVAPPWQDFKFRNNTGNWVLVRAQGDGTDIKVRIYGRAPGWEVRVGEPQISEVVQPNRTPSREYTDALPPGREVKVETAQPGFKSSITREVVKDGQVVDEYVVTSRYLPARDRYMTGRAP